MSGDRAAGDQHVGQVGVVLERDVQPVALASVVVDRVELDTIDPFEGAVDHRLHVHALQRSCNVAVGIHLDGDVARAVLVDLHVHIALQATGRRHREHCKEQHRSDHDPHRTESRTLHRHIVVHVAH